MYFGIFHTSPYRAVSFYVAFYISIKLFFFVAAVIFAGSAFKARIYMYRITNMRCPLNLF